jgi:hypothetical protein
MTYLEHRTGQFARLAGLAFLATFSITSQAESTTYAGQCGAELTAVSVAIDNGNFLGKFATTNESNLQAKLAAADAKIALLKFEGAVDKLMDISDTATALANAAKPKLADATNINAAVGAAITCVQGLPPP